MEKILKALRHLKVETGSLACLGCGHENSCSTKGCAVIREAIEMLEQLQDHEPVTPEEAKRMDYDKVWIGYGEEGEWGIIVNGKLYATDTLEGAGFGELLEETVRGEMLDNPTGDYKVYRSPSTVRVDQEKYSSCELCKRLGETSPCYKDGCFRENAPQCGYRCDKFLEWRVAARRLRNAKFCPECGRPLTEEAWEQMKRRRGHG